MESEQPKTPKKRKASAKPESEESTVVSFRVPNSAFEPYREAIHNSGLDRSKFFRKLFFDNVHKVVISEKKERTEDYSKYLHLVSKISNNLNQLARSLNAAKKQDVIDPQQFLRGLNNLNSIRMLLNAKLGKQDDQ